MQKNEEVTATPAGASVNARVPSRGPTPEVQMAKPPVFWMVVPLILIALAIYFAS